MGGGFDDQRIGDEDGGEGAEGGIQRALGAMSQNGPDGGIGEPEGHTDPVRKGAGVHQGPDEVGPAEDEADPADEAEDPCGAGQGGVKQGAFFHPGWGREFQRGSWHHLDGGLQGSDPGSDPWTSSASAVRRDSTPAGGASPGEAFRGGTWAVDIDLPPGRWG